MNFAATLALLLGGPIGTSAALAGPLPNKPASASTTVAAVGDTGILTIPAVAFTPYEDGYDYENDGRYLKHFHSPGGLLDNGLYYAPVQLPRGAVVTKVTYYYYDTWTSGSGGGVYLQQTQLNLDNYSNMASIGIANSGQGYASSSDDTIDNAFIDTLGEAFWVVLDRPVSQGGADQQIWDCGVVNEYNYRLNLLLVVK